MRAAFEESFTKSTWALGGVTGSDSTVESVQLRYGRVMRSTPALTPIRRIAVLKPVAWWCPPRVNLRFVVLLWIVSVAVSMLVGRSMQIESPVLSVVWIAFCAGAYWFWARRRSAWLIDQGDGSVAVHHRNIFVLPFTGKRLDVLSTADVRWEAGPWWQLGWLEIDGQRWDVLDDGQEAARHLVKRLNEGAYADRSRAPGLADV
jgi:hypothetical protein